LHSDKFYELLVPVSAAENFRSFAMGPRQRKRVMLLLLNVLMRYEDMKMFGAVVWWLNITSMRRLLPVQCLINAKVRSIA